MKKEPENLIKGRIAEVIAEEMLKELGFFVLKLGKEHTANPLTQLEGFIFNCNGNFCLEKLKEEVKEITHVNMLPDFLIVHPNGKSALLEVKFRWDGHLYPNDCRVFKTYPEAHMLIINLEVKDDYKDNIKNSRFNIYLIEENNPDNFNVSPLKDWLEQDFMVKCNEILEKYELLVKKWLGNPEVFKKPE